MRIHIVDKALVVGRLKGLLRQGENLADTVEITAPRTYGALDLSLLSWKMRLYTPQGTLTEQPLTKTVQEEEICLTWLVTGNFTAVAGAGWLELIGWREGGEEIIKFPANEAIAVAAGAAGAEPPPCAWEQALIHCQEAAGRAQAAAVHAPRVGEKGTWEVWAQAAQGYADTGYTAAGPRGEPGPQGPKGEPGKPGADADTALFYQRGETDGLLAGKADLVEGRVPTGQLPQPAVQSVFGRAGEVVGAAGDYTADMVTETEGRKFVSPAQAAAWDGKPNKDEVLGKTGYIYPPYNASGTLDGFGSECHAFIFNTPGTPVTDNRYGFLDVGHFNGRGFSPGPVTYQRFLDWATGQPYYRVHRSGGWRDWQTVCTNANTGNVVHLTLLNGWKLQWDGHAAAYRVGNMLFFNIGPIGGGTVATAQPQGQICSLTAAFGVKSYNSTYCVAVNWTGKRPASARVREGFIIQDTAGGHLPWTAGNIYTIVGMCPIT